MSARRARTALILAAALACGCPSTERESIVVAGDGAPLSAAAIDQDPLALLPSGVVGVGYVDAQAFFRSPFGDRFVSVASRLLPIGQEANFWPQRDLRKVWAGVYSMQGVDGVAVVQGDFDVAAIRAAADRRVATAAGSPLVRVRYAGNDLYVAGNVGFSVLTPHTLVAGNETGMRRAMDRIRDKRLSRDVPEWIVKMVENPKASMLFGGDVTTETHVAAAAQNAPFLKGLRIARVQGNFEAPGMNLAGALTYGDPAAAAQAEATLRAWSQMANLLGWVATFGMASIFQKVQTRVEQSDVQFVAALDTNAMAAILKVVDGLLPGAAPPAGARPPAPSSPAPAGTGPWPSPPAR